MSPWWDPTGFVTKYAEKHPGSLSGGWLPFGGQSDITITLAPGEMPSNMFQANGLWYAQAPDGQWWYVGGAKSWAAAVAIVNGGSVNAKGRTLGHATVRFLRSLPALPTAEAMKGVPSPIWPRIDDTTSMASSWQLDCRRWVRTCLYMLPKGKSYELPLIDDDGVPWLDAAQPPLMSCRRRDESDSLDRVNDIGHAGEKWADANMMIRPAGSAGANRSYTGEEYFIKLVRRTDPVPHWAIIVTGDHAAGSNERNVLIDLVGTGAGFHAAATREEGSAGTAGHWKTELMWSQQIPGSTPTLSIINERKHGVGSIYVANTLESGPTPGQLFFTTGANQGLSTGTSLFTVLPMCVVLGEASLATDRTGSAQSTWIPESWGMGCRSASAGTKATTGHTKAYWSSILLDVASSKYAVNIYNIGDGGTGGGSAALDRTFYVFTIGK